MADKYISALNAAENIDGNDLFVLEQSGEAKKLLGSLLTQYVTRNIMDISIITVSSTTPAYVDSYDHTTGELTLALPKGLGIKTVTNTSTSGRTRTFTITFDDDTTSTFTMLDGRSIVSVAKTSGDHSAGTLDTYTITYDDGNPDTFQVYNGRDGDGSQAADISGIHIATDPTNTVADDLTTLFKDVVAVDILGLSALPRTVSNAAITADHVLVSSTISPITAQSGDWTITTAAGSATISGTLATTADVRFVLARAGTAIEEIDT